MTYTKNDLIISELREQQITWKLGNSGWSIKQELDTADILVKNGFGQIICSINVVTMEAVNSWVANKGLRYIMTMGRANMLRFWDMFSGEFMVIDLDDYGFITSVRYINNVLSGDTECIYNDCYWTSGFEERVLFN